MKKEIDVYTKVFQKYKKALSADLEVVTHANKRNKGSYFFNLVMDKQLLIFCHMQNKV